MHQQKQLITAWKQNKQHIRWLPIKLFIHILAITCYFICLFYSIRNWYCYWNCQPIQIFYKTINWTLCFFFLLNLKSNLCWKLYGRLTFLRFASKKKGSSQQASSKVHHQAIQRNGSCCGMHYPQVIIKVPIIWICLHVLTWWMIWWTRKQNGGVENMRSVRWQSIR